jgi:membrane-associated protein
MMQLFDLPYIIGTYGYVGIFIIIFLESGIFPPLPGDSLLFTAGLMIAVLDLNLFLLIVLIFVATFLGGVLGYEIGVNLEKLHKFSFFKKVLKPEHIEKTHRFFVQYGKFAVIISRFVPVVRTFVPIVAGIANMDYVKYLKYSLISSALWSVSMTLLGYFLGRVFPQIKDYISFVVVFIIAISALPIIFEYFKRKKD